MERRQQSRISTEAIQGRLGSGTEVEVTELSLGGMRVETRAALRPGGSYRVKLLSEGKGEVEARVVWCRVVRCEGEREGGSVVIYRAGLRRVGGD